MRVERNFTTEVLRSIKAACGAGFSTVVDEKQLQDELERRLRERKLSFRREVPLDTGNSSIADFFVATTDNQWVFMSGVVIEVKTDGSRSELLRQLERYSGFPQVEALLVVTPRARLLDLPETLGGKELRAVQIHRKGAP
jgi:hypothetical protein